VGYDENIDGELKESTTYKVSFFLMGNLMRKQLPENASINLKNNEIKRKIYFSLGALLVFILSLYLFEIFPRYLIINIPTPDSNVEVRYGGGWESTIYEIKTEPVLPNLNSHIFIWRQEMVGIFDPGQEMRNWNDVTGFFSKNLEKIGWIQSQEYTPCHRYMPEASFLPRGENGFLAYRRKGFVPTYDFKGGSFVCLAVWSNKGDVSYNVVLISVNQSPLSILASY
jgi:hypothetical protein